MTMGSGSDHVTGQRGKRRGDRGAGWRSRVAAVPSHRAARRSFVALVSLALLMTGLFSVATNLVASPANAALNDPISCSTVYALDQNAGSHDIYAVNTATGALTVQNTITYNGAMNGLAVDGANGNFWAVNQVNALQTSVTVMRVNATTGALTTFPNTPLQNAPTLTSLVMGAFNPATGIYYYGMISSSNLLYIYGFNTNTNSYIPGIIGRVNMGSSQNGDFAFDSNGRLYVASNNLLLSVNNPLPTTGTATGPLLAATNIAAPQSGAQLNSLAFGPDGYLYMASATSGVRTVYQLDPSTGAQIASHTLSPTNTVADFGSCSSPNVIRALKNLPDGRFATGDQFVTTITGTGISQGNVGTTAGTETGIQNQSAAEIAGPVLGRSGQTYTVTETATAGANLADYTKTWTCVDAISGSTVASGTGATGSFVMPDNGSQGADVLCTFTNVPLKPALNIEKTSDVTADTRVGDVVTYAVTATNTGTGTYTAANPARVTDDLTGVLDDATYNADATSSAGAAPTYAAPRLSWSGALAAGASVTLTYSVTLKAGGDRVVRNVAFAGNGQTPACDPPVDGHDPTTGVACDEVEYELPSLSIAKSADRTTLPEEGEEVTYTVVVTNEGPGDYTTAAPATASDDLSDVLDDADLVAGSVSATVGTATVTGSNLSWTGVLAAGQSATITYQVTYTGDGDHQLKNLACVPDEDAEGPPCDTVTIPGAALTHWKTATSADSPVVAGSQIVYTLFFDNDGQAAATVDATDYLTGFLDDAAVTVEPTSPDGLTAVRNGDQIHVTGSVPAGATYTVTYTVTVRPDGQRGNDVATNFLLDTDDGPPTGPCVPTPGQNNDCTNTPISSITYAKSVQASATPVVAGTELTYTIVVINTGEGIANVFRDDDLSDVLDDATMSGNASSDTPSVTVTGPNADDVLQLRGTLAVGGQATITYTVVVNDDDDRGNNKADNFLVKPGDNPPTDCPPASDQCTHTPLPAVKVVKSADPASGTTVVAGQDITYTLTFTNDGEAAGPVAFDDVISGVLDDANVTVAPASSDPALSVSAITGGRFTVTGTLAAGQTVKVTYTVTVKADVDRGDDVLLNFVVDEGEQPPVDCVATTGLCTEHPVPSIDVQKSVDPASGTEVVAGQDLTYTLTFNNDGAAAGDVAFDDVISGVLDDATLTSGPTSSDPALSASAVSGGRFSVTGTLAPGQTVTVTYTVKVKADGNRGDNILGNFVVKAGENPPTDCEPGDELCTENPVPAIHVKKSVDPATGTTVVAGQDLTYTLTFSNDGEATGAVAYDDVISGVLDDANLTSGPTSSLPALTVSAVAGGRFSVTGTLAPGQIVTVTYTVKVKADGNRGDNLLANFVVDEGENPPTDCDESTQLCTENPVPAIHVKKSVDPVSGTTVVAGQDLTYTLTFTNDGKGAGAVAYDDVISGVLDDANLTSGPTSSDPALTVSAVTGGRFTVTGNLGAGQTVTVTYTVKVKADGNRGDNLLANFVVPEGEEPPTECDEDTELCTENPVPLVTVKKSVDPASGTTVVAGQDLTYTLTFANDGEAAGDVAFDDVISGVLDDANLTSGPTSSDAALTVSAVTGGRFTVSGTLAPGQTVTVTYTVKVRADGNRGDDLLANFVVEEGENPPTECDEDTELCTENPVPAIHVTKSVDPESGTKVVAGDELTYTLTFSNDGQAAGDVAYDDVISGVLDDADVTVPPASSDPALTVSAISGGRFTVTGTLAVGQSVTVTYTVKVKADGARGDNLLANFVVPEGEEPPTDCVPANELCTENPVPLVTVKKSVDPESGTTVSAGQELTYTLTFSNDGKAAGDVAYDDVIAGVLDDANVTVPPASSDPALTVSAISGGRFTVTGTLAAGQTVTVTYTVKVQPDGSRGDDVLANFVVEEGENPPTECDEDTELCTENPVPAIHVKKSVDPASGTTVLAGQQLTYTLTFTNDGAAAGPVAYDDVIVGVIDDADLVVDPAASDPALTVSAVTGGRFTVSGTLAAGQTVTVTYTVEVQPDGERGDEVLLNYVVPEGEEPPTECVPGNELCTENPVPLIDVDKSVDPASGTTVLAGDVLTYTLTFTNDGKAAGEVAHDDVIAGVLDDATVVSDPVSSDPALSVSAISGGRFTVSGTLTPGQSVTVTYAVKVKPDADRGDNLLTNFVVEEGEEPPTACDEEVEDCTVNPVPLIDVKKSVDPASGTTVLAGDDLTYTLTFTNAGEAAGDVAYDDVISGVLDDANLTSGPTSSDAALTASAVAGGRFTVTGSLAPGQTVTVTYTVKVKADADRGDNLLANFVVPEGEEPPSECVPDNELCTENPVPLIDVKKSVDPASGTTVLAGDELTYTLTFTNGGQAAGDVAYDDVIAGVLDDADVTVAPASSDPALTASAVSGGRFTVTGTLDAGQTVTVTYTVKVRPDDARGDNLLANFVVPEGEEPPTECDEATELCTENPVPLITVDKSVDPSSGSTVLVGDELTYTLTFGNEGKAAGAVAFDDVISGVLDDATLIVDPVSSDPALTVSALTDGRFTVSGSLAPGQTVTVTYTVKVKPDSARGDNLLANFVVPEGEEPPTECVDEGVGNRRAASNGRLCTENPVPLVDVTKSVDPISGSTVVAGQELTYTLTFTNTGKAAGPVAYDDVLAGVLDDARVTVAPASSDPALEVSAISGGRFSVTGTLAAGQTVTVTYTVQVKADGKRGDNLLANFVVDQGAEPPTECVPTNDRCTENPVSQLEVEKSVDPADGSKVKPGQVLTYTLTFANAGRAAARVDWTDDLTEVLDDADFVAGSLRSPVLDVAGPADAKLRITGVLAGGRTTTVTYQVKVKDGQRGDDRLDNFLVATGDTPPGTCTSTNPLCTHNPVDPPDNPDNPWLPNTGGPMLGLLVLGLLLLAGGCVTLARRAKRS